MGVFSKPAARSFRVEGKQVVCPQCDNVLFHDRKASLNTAVTEMFNLAWSDREARVLICANCSRLEWFLNDDALTVESG
jgi:uncharacterized protein with PIN domain